MDGKVFQDEVTENEVQWQTIVDQQDISTNFHLLKPLNPLSGKRENVFQCEICQNAATLQCISCHSTWCSHEHFLLDDEPAHMHVCPRLTELWCIEYQKQRQQTGDETVGKSQDQKVETRIRLEIFWQCQKKTRGYISDRNFIMGVAPALRALKMAGRLFGLETIEYLEADLQLSKVHLGLRKQKFVNRALSQISAQMNDLINKELQRLQYKTRNIKIKNLRNNFVKFPFVEIPIRILMNVNPRLISTQGKIFNLYGAFFQSLGEAELAVKYFAEAAYFASLAFGPTSLQVTLYYLELAKSKLIGQKPSMLNYLQICPFQRIKLNNKKAQQSLFMLSVCVDIWATSIRRALNQSQTIQYAFCDIGEPRLLLQDTKAISALFLGTDSFLYIKATVTLCLLFVMYDGDYEAVVEAGVAKKAILQFMAWNYKSTKEYAECQVFLGDIRDLMSVLETPEVMRRVAEVERNLKGRHIV